MTRHGTGRTRAGVSVLALLLVGAAGAAAIAGNAPATAAQGAASPGAAGDGGAALPPLDQIIAKHIEAHGGASRWEKVKTLTLKGNMKSWSRTGAFTLVRTADRKYRLDGIQDDKPLVMAFDGANAWWENLFLQEGAQPIRGADLAAFLPDLDYPTPLFHHQAAGHAVTLRGREDFEGRPALAVEVKRKEGGAETWYLDPQSFLEIGREAPGADFGRPVPQHTFFEDFRTVSGLVIPFHVESQWYTRERTLSVESVEVNAPVDEAIFRRPPPMGMAPLLPLAGEWDVAEQIRDDPGSPWRDVARQSRIDSLLGGALLQESFTSSQGNGVVRTLSYDRYRKRYRISEVNEAHTFMDIREGDFEEGKKLVVSNATTGTPWLAFGMTIHFRLTIADITGDGFRVEEEYSIDGGKEWTAAVRSVYTRRKQGQQPG